MKVICKEQFNIQAYDDNGFAVEGQYIPILEGTTWEVSKEKDRMIGGEVRLRIDGGAEDFWIEITKERFEQNFEKYSERSCKIRMDIDPFKILFEATAALYPDCAATIYFVPGKEVEKKEKGALGITNFPPDGGAPDILIKVEQTLPQMIDIMAHELAHAAMGVEAEHGPLWEAAYKAIFEKYSAILDELEAEE